MGDKLRVARMIDSLDPDNNFHQLRIVLADVLDQLGLGIGGSGHQNLAGVGDRLRDRLEELVILRRMAAADGVGFVVDVSRRTIRMQHQPLDIGWAEMEYARFMVVDPHDGVKVMAAHGNSPFARTGAIQSSIDDHLADRPQCDASELQMRPGERDADNGHGQ